MEPLLAANSIFRKGASNDTTSKAFDRRHDGAESRTDDSGHLRSTGLIVCSRLCLRPTATVAAENLFLRRQLGLFVERKVKPRRATDSIRFTLGRRLCLLKIPIVRKSLKLSDRAANLRQRCSNYYCPFSSR